MRFGKDLRGKAIVALEEAVRDCRYGRVRRTFAVRFALAYLWSQAGGDRGPFKQFWDVLDSANEVFRFSTADRALLEIHGRLGIDRDHARSMEIWGLCQKEHRRRQGP